MTYEDIEYKEKVLRECFKEKLASLNVDGINDMCTVKNVKMYGALWHYTHQLLLAEGNNNNERTVEIKSTSLTMAGGK